MPYTPEPAGAPAMVEPVRAPVGPGYRDATIAEPPRTS
jgi:hypothetical protein